MHQGSAFGIILFNFYINELFLFITQETIQIYCYRYFGFFSKTHSDLISVLKEAGVVLIWLKQNQIVASPEKFYVILLRKDQTNKSGESLSINGDQLKSEETVKLLRIYLDYKLNFEQHTSENFIQATSKLNVLKRLKGLIAFNEKRILVQSFIFCN